MCGAGCRHKEAVRVVAVAGVGGGGRERGAAVCAPGRRARAARLLATTRRASAAFATRRARRCRRPAHSARHHTGQLAAPPGTLHVLQELDCAPSLPDSEHSMWMHF